MNTTTTPAATTDNKVIFQRLIYQTLYRLYCIVRALGCSNNYFDSCFRFPPPPRPSIKQVESNPTPLYMLWILQSPAIALPPRVTFSLAQFKIVCLRSEKPTCAPSRLLEVSPTSPSKQFHCRLSTENGPLPSFKGRSSSCNVQFKSLRASKSNYVKRLCLVVPLVSRP